ncbi:MAG: hypothetical protein K2J74_06200, partial [Muribaculaceae bacterium]|nr:hypothetical protein [Muribaculaceae bacterium]
MEEYRLNIIAPPILLGDMEDVPKKELRELGKWFFAIKESRLIELEKFIHRDPEFSNWKMDYTPESLITIQPWAEKQVITEPLTETDIARWKESIHYTKFRMPIPERKVSAITDFIMFDLSIYFGEVLIRNNDRLEWTLCINRGRKYVNYGHIVIPINKYTQCNPFRIFQSFSHYCKENEVEDNEIYNRYLKTCRNIRYDF